MDIKTQVMLSKRAENITNKDSILDILELVRETSEVVYKNNIGYYNVPCMFDIETSSFMQNQQKVGIMYIWMINICGYNIYGRTWDEYHSFIRMCSIMLRLSLKRRLVIYVHNLGYEHGFIHSHFNWYSNTTMKSHKPYNSVTENGIEYRCSLILSGYKLEKVADNLKNHKRAKKVGQLNYDVIRHSETPLTLEEYDYCFSDVEIGVDYIYEMIDEYGDITKIPNTKTGRVRRLFRQKIFGEKKSAMKYRDMISKLTISSIQEYNQLKKAFSGGFTHCNPFYSNRTVNDIVMKIDFNSSYPYVMVSECEFPMSNGTYIEYPTNDEFEFIVNNYACVFTIVIKNLECIFPNDNYISSSKCRDLKITNVPLNNGRVVDAEKLSITITNIDWQIIKRNYKFESYYICDLYYYVKGYLPKEFISVLLDLYKSKTELKGLEGKEAEYMSSKEDVNSSYGMTVTDIFRDEILFENGKWVKRKLTEKEFEEKLNDYNTDENRFLFYPWGVFITALARRNLWLNIFAIRNDYIYSDTDSLFLKNPQRHIETIKNYNGLVISKLEKASQHFNIPIEYFMPKTIKGEIKPLGVWDIEDVCLRFKSLGAKRYLYEVPEIKVNARKKLYNQSKESLLTNNPDWYTFETFRTSGKHTKLSLTVAGVEKKEGLKYLDRNGHDEAFKNFNENLIIPKEYSGKSILTYINEPRSGMVTDYLGNTAHYEETSCVHFDKGDYSFNVELNYLDLVLGLQALD